MKPIKILMMAFITILSASVFAQVSTNLRANTTNQKTDKTKYTCPMNNGVFMDVPGMYSTKGNTNNWSPKERMKMELMKINAGSMNHGLTAKMPCNFSNSSTALNSSAKERMRMGAMRMYNSPMNANVMTGMKYSCPVCGMYLNKMGNKYTCPMMTNVTGDKQAGCFSCASTINLSGKEKMKLEVMKI